jgi:monoamine oxidase
LQEAGLSLLPIEGLSWVVEHGKFSRQNLQDPHQAELHCALQELQDDLSVAEFLRQRFSAPEYGRLRHSIERMVEGYDAADPERASILALRDEWMGGGRSAQARIAGGYGALVEFLASQCRSHGVAIHLGSAVIDIETNHGGAVVRCANGDVRACDAVILTVPLPLLNEIALPAAQRERAAAAADIGFGNVIKILLGFDSAWWLDRRTDLADLTFLLSNSRIPVWWTQHPVDRSVLTGWFGGRRTEAMADLGEHQLIEAGLASLADIFGLDAKQISGRLVAVQAINWAHDRFARGAYSYATPQTRAAQAVLSKMDGVILFSGEALYGGRDMGTVEAALASGLATARILLG